MLSLGNSHFGTDIVTNAEFKFKTDHANVALTAAFRNGYLFLLEKNREKVSMVFWSKPRTRLGVASFNEHEPTEKTEILSMFALSLIGGNLMHSMF